MSYLRGNFQLVKNPKVQHNVFYFILSTKDFNFPFFSQFKLLKVTFLSDFGRLSMT